MVRVIYLLAINNFSERRQLIDATLQGKKWKVQNPNGKWRNVTDQEMVCLAQKLRGWTLSVYKFGCSFIHFSDFHNHLAANPFETLEKSEREDLLFHMRNYHGGPHSDHPEVSEIASYLPRVFDKISSNLEYYLERLEKDGSLDECDMW